MPPRSKSCSEKTSDTQVAETGRELGDEGQRQYGEQVRWYGQYLLDCPSPRVAPNLPLSGDP